MTVWLARTGIPGALLALGMLVSGCSGGSDTTATPGSTPGSSPVCAKDAHRTPPPATLPTDLPFPDGAVVTGAEARSGERTIVTAVVPGGFTATLKFLQDKLPAAGYQPTEGEVEKHDAESNFAGKGVKGRWTIREIPGCDGDILLTYLVQPTP